MADFIEDKYEDLGVRAVRARWFYPVEGMLSGYTGGRIVGVMTEGPDDDETWSVQWCFGDRVSEWEEWEPDDEEWIDLRDSATHGAFHEVVMSTWGEYGSIWKVNRSYRYIGESWSGEHKRDEDECLVDALESAPCTEDGSP